MNHMNDVIGAVEKGRFTSFGAGSFFLFLFFFFLIADEKESATLVTVEKQFSITENLPSLTF